MGTEESLIGRVATVFVELDERPRFDVDALLAGGDGVDAAPRWRLHAPALPATVDVDLAQLAVLQSLPAEARVPRAVLVERHGEAAVDALLSAGVLRELPGECAPDPSGNAVAAGHAAGPGDAAPPSPAADDGGIAWWPPALIAQLAGRWRDVDVGARRAAGEMADSRQLVAEFGPPPPTESRRGKLAQAHVLPPPQATPFDALLAQRRTCRNFDAGATLPLATLSTMLHRAWGATGAHALAPGAVVVRKSSPAGGGLHAVEATLLAVRVDGLAPGLHHYLPLQHALAPLQPMTTDAARAWLRRAVAGQDWFADAPAIVVMTVRFDRLFWKYRRHAKAWRVAHLDAGHLSQTMHLAAADLGLGAFVTAAINDGDIDDALGLSPLREAAIVVVGFGAPAAERRYPEIDMLPAARG